MPICTSCGQQFDEGVRFCPACGSPAQQAQANADQGAYQQNYQQQNYQQPVYQQPPYQQAGAAYAGDKTMAILAVVFPILFFLPLVAGNKDEFGKFWANQALLLFLLGIVASITAAIIIGIIIGIAEFVFWIIALIAVCKGEMKPLPLIGGIKIIQ
ncbi:MAG TPA: hypothetical protein PK438_03320 [Clostridia bacterium]|nr:MAG: hypothetical protein BWY35_00732 [Firmicutes bacterium ADurb.Bin248]HOG01860.1 hypothetical protein [Clostridia bacterium]HOS18293.1 hypothetical protein [Clostridia bacterium]HPK14805.1 hypothetical protein [Clostridia bacterium]